MIYYFASEALKTNHLLDIHRLMWVSNCVYSSHIRGLDMLDYRAEPPDIVLGFLVVWLAVHDFVTNRLFMCPCTTTIFRHWLSVCALISRLPRGIDGGSRAQRQLRGTWVGGWLENRGLESPRGNGLCVDGLEAALQKAADSTSPHGLFFTLITLVKAVIPRNLLASFVTIKLLQEHSSTFFPFHNKMHFSIAISTILSAMAVQTALAASVGVTAHVYAILQ